MLRGQYAHALGSYSEATFHFIEAGKLTQSKSMQAMCQVYAAVSYICIGGPESSAEALDLIGPVYQMMDSFVGVREKTSALFAYGFLLMRQQNLQEARSGTSCKGSCSGTFPVPFVRDLCSCVVLPWSLCVFPWTQCFGQDPAAGGAPRMHVEVMITKTTMTIETTWAETLATARATQDLALIPSLYQELGEKGNEMENLEYQNKKVEDLQKRLNDARSSIHHIELIDKVRTEVHQLHEHDIKRAMAGPSMRVNLDIPESVGLSSPDTCFIIKTRGFRHWKTWKAKKCSSPLAICSIYGTVPFFTFFSSRFV
ncbi:tetratricopeptide repeat (TPR)-like superfamily protein [Actinidia rufa]|uniref:Tetratricopeptide repeat (TPR)-like superfamily protein n=1 Tax=Actinidia rufa TaxID=165716 RepID=A0A7J0DMR8_9ERIC|nr:tetratricopeptide repeat (TPR)-like superfamily protein [Actinidia rufa]